MVQKRVMAVVPAHNEEKYISSVVRQTRKYVNKVIVVDDASTDNTGKLAKQAGALVLRHKVNLYKGAALKTGCEAAILLGASIVVLVDGDGQHNPKEIPKLINALEHYDFVIGSRAFNKNMPFNSKLGNRLLSLLARILYNTKIHDSQSGYRAFNTNIYPKIVWASRDYGVETEMIQNMSRNHVSHTEVGVKTIYHDDYKGTTPLDGLKIAVNMVSKRFL
jgi:glycosyltransferase involved in cell wall biosynthesis